MRTILIFILILTHLSSVSQTIIVENKDLTSVVFTRIVNRLKFADLNARTKNFLVRTNNGEVTQEGEEIVWKPSYESFTSELLFFDTCYSFTIPISSKTFKVCELAIPKLKIPRGSFEVISYLDILNLDSLDFDLDSKLTYCYPFSLKNYGLEKLCKINSFEILFDDPYTKTVKTFLCETNSVSNEFKDFFKKYCRINTKIQFQNIKATVLWIENTPILLKDISGKTECITIIINL